MCEVILITSTGTTKETYASLDEAVAAARATKNLRYYRCFQVYGRKREKKKREE